MRICALFLLLLLFTVVGAASAQTFSYTGSLDPNNADDVFITSFTMYSASAINIQSYGYGGTSGTLTGANGAGQIIPGGGFDTYFSLFQGSGPSATFFASNDDGGCGPATPDPVCEDSRLLFSNLAAGTYTLAVTLPSNYSIAENYGYGTLGDGFIDLQADYYDAASDAARTSNYAFDITSPGIVPEPDSWLLLATGGFAVFAAIKMRRASQNIQAQA